MQVNLKESIMMTVIWITGYYQKRFRTFLFLSDSPTHIPSLKD